MQKKWEAVRSRSVREIAAGKHRMLFLFFLWPRVIEVFLVKREATRRAENYRTRQRQGNNNVCPVTDTNEFAVAGSKSMAGHTERESASRTYFAIVRDTSRDVNCTYILKWNMYFSYDEICSLERRVAKSKVRFYNKTLAIFVFDTVCTRGRS